MQIVFMGSGSFGVPVVRALRSSPSDKLVGVVTQPDRPSGRGRGVSACPVKAAMASAGVPILQPEKIGDAVNDVRDLSPDLIVVTDYGQYIPGKILFVPALNVHPSLLPKYRGAAPIPWAIANGDTMTGVTIQHVAKKMDSGDIVLQQEFDIGADESAVELEKRLADGGAALLVRALDLMRSGHIHATPQDESHATDARKLTKEDGRIDWKLSSVEIERRVRAFQPWPGTFCQTPRGSLKILRAQCELGSWSQKPGTFIEGPMVVCGSGALRLLEVQPEGKRPMPGEACANGRFLQPGDVLS